MSLRLQPINTPSSSSICASSCILSKHAPLAYITLSPSGFCVIYISVLLGLAIISPRSPDPVALLQFLAVVVTIVTLRNRTRGWRRRRRRCQRGGVCSSRPSSPPVLAIMGATISLKAALLLTATCCSYSPFPALCTHTFVVDIHIVLDTLRIVSSLDGENRSSCIDRSIPQNRFPGRGARSDCNRLGGRGGRIGS